MKLLILTSGVLPHLFYILKCSSFLCKVGVTVLFLNVSR